MQVETLLFIFHNDGSTDTETSAYMLQICLFFGGGGAPESLKGCRKGRKTVRSNKLKPSFTSDLGVLFLYSVNVDLNLQRHYVKYLWRENQCGMFSASSKKKKSSSCCILMRALVSVSAQEAEFECFSE